LKISKNIVKTNNNDQLDKDENKINNNKADYIEKKVIKILKRKEIIIKIKK
jgi:hypothetical protein